ncbi:hypothetical protein KAFR_0B01180 [Kazachstania africana CBS 2517]|uniref:Uncharacterized protein n=1 Tax=Kazachstania africana (strain ATCC 22294 / BCRC 22015 / CBS 2517 / CECT 1963 / NBRC 1671 / NRRL Y-8276) TaxID=1071382 RepID=H2APW7_KAZAF|nr:hypothetical protein KAFR_0B01180 [Kazachstania africana CBS 2517]CCF56417.1 hypothetical protein KAFR_0B01180 [Kazachstania africana CBS 2517]
MRTRSLGSRDKNDTKKLHLITPEEPKRRSDEDGERLLLSSSPMGGSNERENEIHQFLTPSVKTTKNLEVEITRLITKLKTSTEPTDYSKDEIIKILNKTLVSLSHWILQAQLWQLNKLSTDRNLIETNLAKKEIEFLKHKLVHSNSNLNRTIPKASGKIVKPNISSFMAKHGTEDYHGGHGTSNSFKLVENNKPHPRMRRRSDNPLTNEYVRVFQLQKDNK